MYYNLTIPIPEPDHVQEVFSLNYLIRRSNVALFFYKKESFFDNLIHICIGDFVRKRDDVPIESDSCRVEENEDGDHDGLDGDNHAVAGGLLGTMEKLKV